MYPKKDENDRVRLKPLPMPGFGHLKMKTRLENHLFMNMEFI